MAKPLKIRWQAPSATQLARTSSRRRLDLRPWLLAIALHGAACAWAMTVSVEPPPPETLYKVNIAYLGEEAPPAPKPAAETPRPPAPEPVRPEIAKAPEPVPAPVPPPPEVVQSVVPPPALAPEPAPAPPAPVSIAVAVAVAAPPAAEPVAAVAPPGPPSAPSGQGQGLGGRSTEPAPSPAALDLAYWRGVRGEIVRHLRYPRMPEGAKIDTNIVLHLRIDAQGRLLAAATDDDTTPFARAATRAVAAAAPFGQPADDTPLAVELPIRFVHAK